MDGNNGTAGRPPRVTATALRASAGNWYFVAVVYILLAVAGAIIIGIAATPVTHHAYLPDERNVGVGFGVGAGVFVAAMIPILPYFMIGKVMYALAELLPDGPSAPGTSSGPDQMTVM